MLGWGFVASWDSPWIHRDCSGPFAIDQRMNQRMRPSLPGRSCNRKWMPPSLWPLWREEHLPSLFLGFTVSHWIFPETFSTTTFPGLLFLLAVNCSPRRFFIPEKQTSFVNHQCYLCPRYLKYLTSRVKYYLCYLKEFAYGLNEILEVSISVLQSIC